MNFDVKFQADPMTLKAELGEIYDVTGDEYENGYRDGVAAQQTVEDSIIDRSISGEYVNERLKAVGNSGFYNCARLTAVSCPLVEKIGTYAFTGAALLASVEFPLAALVDANSFQGCTSLTAADFPSCTDLSGSAFSGCTSLSKINFPLATWVGGSTFANCKKLASADFPSVTTVGGAAFSGCSALTMLALRVGKVCTLQNVSAFQNTPIASGTGYIYVPDDLVESYKTATNWSTYADQIKPLSELEG